jgi:Flp pilus assembly protein TadD
MRMTDGFADRLAQLRARWEGDRSSRIFLQLAEEYRHLGRVQEALEVLNAGLEEHPGYLSALVAKGRCLLELGDALGARPVLERVVQQDPTQMVANKLLVRACLETGEPERARQRLELYSLLNDSDPEIEELERRVEAMSRPSQAPDSPRLEEPAERPHMDPSAAQGSNAATSDAQPQPPASASPPPTPAPAANAADNVFDLGPATPRSTARGGDDLFELAAAGPAAAEDPLPPIAPVSGAAQEAGPGSGFRARGEGNGAEPFPDLAPEHSRRIYLAHLEAEAIFVFSSPAKVAAVTTASPAGAAQTAQTTPAAPPAPAGAAPPPAPAASTAVAAHAAMAPPAQAAPAPQAAPAAQAIVAAPAAQVPGGGVAAVEQHAVAGQLQPVGEASARAPARRSTVAVPPTAARPQDASAARPQDAAAPPPPSPDTAPNLTTLTLAELYLRQGHVEEAERMLREVAGREPENASVRQALDQIERRRGAQPAGRHLDAPQLLAGSDPGASPAARKAHLLQGYLTRLRQPRSPHVS